MCLILVQWQPTTDYPLVVAANRDEFHARPTRVCGRWPDDPKIIAGRDLEAGGTWLGVTATGRFAAVTNVREPHPDKAARSRGELTANFLRSTGSTAAFLATLHAEQYAGFNLLLGDSHSLTYISNRGDSPCSLAPGIYGLSNHRLDTPWPKLVEARSGFARALERIPDDDALFAVLADRKIVADVDLPDTGVSKDWERRLSAIFVQSENYGTRASTVLWQEKSGAGRVRELSFAPDGSISNDCTIDFNIHHP